MRPYYEDDAVTIYHADCREVFPALADESIDLVFTDPPYAREHDDVFRYLSDGVPRLLKPGKSLLAYCGHYQLPFVLDQLGEVLQYNWLCMQRNGGGHARIWGRRALATFKPIVWFTKGPIERGPPMSDDVVVWAGGITQRKADHEWGQPLAYLPVLRLTHADDVILDPFMGSGSTLRAAKDMGRRAIGVEIDERHCETAAQRMGQEVLTLSWHTDRTFFANTDEQLPI